MRDLIDQTLGTAERNLEHGDTRGAMNRAYYAMFYVAQLYLRERATDETIGTKAHAGTRRQFDRFAIKRDGLDRSLSTALSRLEEQRLASDYELTQPDPTIEETRAALDTARRFVRAVLGALEPTQ